MFVDGRYILQAKIECGNNFKIIDITKNLPKNIFKNITLGVDPKIITSNNIRKLFSNKILIKEINHNLIGTIVLKKIKIKQFFKLDDKVVGEKKSIKLNRIKDI